MGQELSKEEENAASILLKRDKHNIKSNKK